jgi:cytosine/adenosine deaminase-related metal-dependent hydrolase
LSRWTPRGGSSSRARVDVGKASELRTEYGSGEVLDASRKIVIPGLVNAHSHLFAMFSRD